MAARKSTRKFPPTTPCFFCQELSTIAHPPVPVIVALAVGGEDDMLKEERYKVESCHGCYRRFRAEGERI